MRGLILIFSLVSVCLAHAGLDVEIRLGRGRWICTSEGIKDHPTIARGASRMRAEHFSQKACGQLEGSEFHCKVKKCVQDPTRSNNQIDINFSIFRKDKRISVTLNNGQSLATCRASAFMKSYMVEAPTELEARVLARQTCIRDGNHGMHCNVDQCETMAPRNRVDVKSGKKGFDLKGSIEDLKDLIQ